MLRSAGVSVRGPAHGADGVCNQDALGLWGWQGGHIVVVSDGLGSRPLSHIGSRLACKVARQVIRSGSTWDDPKALIRKLYRAWMDELPIPPHRAACTFLLAACRDNGDALVAQLGDGLLVYQSEGRFGVLSAERAGFSNQTDALGISKSWADWRVARLKLQASGDGVVLMTDGISDDLLFSRREAFFGMLRKEFGRLSSRQARGWLRRQLENWPTPGHIDDKTIAMIFRGSR